MKMRTHAALIAGALLLPAAAMGQQQIQWSQTLNLPKALNVPKDAQVDVLGIMPGDTYAEAKAKLEAYVQGADTRPQDKAVSEAQVAFQLPLPNNQRVEAVYVGQIEGKIRRIYAPHKPRGNDQTLIAFSSPASGHQVIGIERFLDYDDQADQPRISEIVNSLKAKLKASPQVFETGSSVEYRFQFNDGRAYAPPGANITTCTPAFGRSRPNVQHSEIKQINATGDCDVVLTLSVNYGISKDHAKSMWFKLSDNERGKQNTLADFAFFDSYVKNLQSRPGGAAPKL